MASASCRPRHLGSPRASISPAKSSKFKPNSARPEPWEGSGASNGTSWVSFPVMTGVRIEHFGDRGGRNWPVLAIRFRSRANRPRAKPGFQAYNRPRTEEMTNERNLRRTVLPNGLIVLTERMEHLRSVAMGVWIKSGSRCEPAETNGISHFVEHMLFKGTRSRSAQHIAREMDSIGGNLDAFTGKETICFTVKSLSDHVPIALDVVTDVVLHPIFASTDIERERGVILEEIKIDEDNPDVLVHELFTQNFWKDHPLGKPILGTTETVGRLTQDKLFAYHGDRFHGGNIVFSAAGNLDHDQFVAAVEAKFAMLGGGEPLTELSAPEASARIV